MGDDVTYSGTVAGAIEGTMLGLRSIALSQAYDFENGRVLPWGTAEAHAPELIRRLVRIDLPEATFLNVNFPNCGPEKVEGTIVTSQGRLTHGLQVEERQDGRGFPYYWLKFSRRQHEFREGTDLFAINNGKISVTPLKLDLTDYETRNRISEALG